ncbi:TPA: hypothetical protein DEP21_03215 [Patescibacteria group bacterium]|nr:hypothetical protein [Candidatus Gracilibacteria bacterium]
MALVAIKMFVNYNNIEIAIEQTIDQSLSKQQELAFAENFQLNYERSEYSQLFLKHENNMLMPGEFIIKFQTLSKIDTGEIERIENKETFITNPEQSWKQFFYERLYKTN